MTGRAILYMITHRRHARMVQDDVGTIDILECRTWPWTQALRIQPDDGGRSLWLASFDADSLEEIAKALTPAGLRMRAVAAGAR